MPRGTRPLAATEACGPARQMLRDARPTQPGFTAVASHSSGPWQRPAAHARASCFLAQARYVAPSRHLSLSAAAICLAGALSRWRDERPATAVTIFWGPRHDAFELATGGVTPRCHQTDAAPDLFATYDLLATSKQNTLMLRVTSL
jgi:hypothetical protein